MRYRISIQGQKLGKKCRYGILSLFSISPSPFLPSYSPPFPFALPFVSISCPGRSPPPNPARRYGERGEPWASPAGSGEALPTPSNGLSVSDLITKNAAVVGKRTTAVHVPLFKCVSRSQEQVKVIRSYCWCNAPIRPTKMANMKSILGWRFGLVVTRWSRTSINEVTLRRAPLVLGWVTVSGV